MIRKRATVRRAGFSSRLSLVLLGSAAASLGLWLVCSPCASGAAKAPKKPSQAPNKRSPRGFGAGTVKRSPKEKASSPEVQRQQRLGKSKHLHEKRFELLQETAEKTFTIGAYDVRLLVPQYVTDIGRFSAMVEVGAGTVSDIVWPAEQALAHALLDRRQLWERTGVCELGAGLGLAGVVAAAAGAPRVLLTDRDGLVLDLAARSAALNGVGNVVSICDFDWADKPSWPTGGCGLVAAADVLYDNEVAAPLVNLIAHLGGEALIMEPVNAERLQLNSVEHFVSAARAKGLTVYAENYESPFEMPSPMQLLTVGRDQPIAQDSAEVYDAESKSWVRA